MRISKCIFWRIVRRRAEIWRVKVAFFYFIFLIFSLESWLWSALSGDPREVDRLWQLMRLIHRLILERHVLLFVLSHAHTHALLARSPRVLLFDGEDLQLGVAFD